MKFKLEFGFIGLVANWHAACCACVLMNLKTIANARGVRRGFYAYLFGYLVLFLSATELRCAESAGSNIDAVVAEQSIVDNSDDLPTLQKNKRITGISRSVNCPECDPTYGSILLQKVLPNMRRWGNYVMTEKNGKRQYAIDKVKEGSNPALTVCLVLFPSPSGELNSRVNNKHRLSYYFGPEAAAQCINFLLWKTEALDLVELLSRSPLLLDLRAQKRVITDTIDSLKNEGKKIPKIHNKALNEINIAIKKEEKVIPALQDTLTKISEVESFTQSLYRVREMGGETLEIVIQTLLAFVYDRVDTEADAQHYLEALDPSLKQTQGEVASPTLADEINAFLREQQRKSVYPYIEKPTSSGPTFECDEKGNFTNRTFSDCVESAIRHIFNLLMFNPLTQGFDLPNSASEKLRNFYIEQSKAVTQGSSTTRSAWNRVMSHLPGVQYHVNGNNIQSGVENLYRILSQVVGLDANLESLDQTEIETKFTELFSKIAGPQKTASVSWLAEQDLSQTGVFFVGVDLSLLHKALPQVKFAISTFDSHSATDFDIPLDTFELTEERLNALNGIERSALLLLPFDDARRAPLANTIFYHHFQALPSNHFASGVYREHLSEVMNCRENLVSELYFVELFHRNMEVYFFGEYEGALFSGAEIFLNAEDHKRSILTLFDQMMTMLCDEGKRKLQWAITDADLSSETFPALEHVVLKGQAKNIVLCKFKYEVQHVTGKKRRELKGRRRDAKLVIF
ncbi:MAG TPA: hypothetical protein DHV51_03375 [Opitutae bacterium]|nr:hypothetical protein [Opitutae bacterium]